MGEEKTLLQRVETLEEEISEGPTDSDIPSIQDQLKDALERIGELEMQVLGYKKLDK